MSRVLDDPDAAAHHDVEFHRHIACATENPLYVVMLDSINDLLLQVRKAAMAQNPERSRTAFGFHARVLEAICSRDAVTARKAMQDHLDDVSVALESMTLDTLLWLPSVP